MGITRAEQETIFRWDEEEKVVHVYSASPVTWRKLRKLGLPVLKETQRDGECTGRFYRIAISEFRWRLKGKQRGNAGALRAGRVPRNQSGVARPAQEGAGG